MRLVLTDSERQVRDEMRAFLAEHMPAHEDLPHDFDARIAFLREWQSKLAQARLINIAWPEEYGGRGASLMEQIVADEELARAGAPELVGVVGLEVVGPSIVQHGRPDQKEAYLEGILSGEDIWCQGFSEPDAGSDLASLRTRAEDRGDHYVLNGQKVWTSWAQYASWCAVLAVTDPDVSSYKGISYLIVDMDSPGIEVRTLTQITGDAEFSEVYFDDVIVPKANILGEPGQGWPLAMHTLTNERGPVVMSVQVKLRVALDSLTRDAGRMQRDGAPALEHPKVRASLTRAHVAIEVLKHQAYRSMSSFVAKGGAGPESSVDKLFMATAVQRLGAACLEVLGPFAGVADGPGVSVGLPWQHHYMYGRAASIYGGTEQIQKNIVAERVLGLPRSA